MFCHFGSKVCHVLRKLMKILTTWLSALDRIHDRIYCSSCEPTYVSDLMCPQKGDLLNNESEC